MQLTLRHLQASIGARADEIRNGLSLAQIHTPIKEGSAGELPWFRSATTACYKICKDFLHNKRVAMRCDLQHRFTRKGLTFRKIRNQALIQ